VADRPALDQHTLVLLVRPPDAPDMSDEELDELQAQHLAFLAAMRERGVMHAAGPFQGQPDERLRGMCLYRAGVEETRRLAAEDPSVRAGRMAVQVFSWYTRPGELRFGG
jgi:uncharacterized protein